MRWTVAGKVRYATFGTKALADSHEAKLRTAARQGEAFDAVTGLPLSTSNEDEGHDQEPEHDVTWYEFACAYVDMKWDEMSPNSRRSIADSLATATTALLATKRGAPKPAQLRKALYGWAFNTKRREAGPPAGLAPAIAWIERNTVPLADLGDPDTLRRVLNQLARKQDGQPAAATVVARKRAVLFNLLGYAVDKKHFPMNPLTTVRWKSPKVAEAIDRRRVVNLRQAQALLEALAAQGSMGRHLEAFFGCIYYAGLRPSEAVMLTLDELQLPERGRRMGLALPRGFSTLHRRSVERDRRPPRTPPAQAPGRQGSPPGPSLTCSRPAAPQAHRRTRHRTRRPPLPGRRRRPALRHRLRPRLGEGPPGRTYPRRRGLAARRTPLRPTARPPVHLAQRRRRPRPGRRMGRQQRPRPPPRLRQMPHRLRAACFKKLEATEGR